MRIADPSYFEVASQLSAVLLLATVAEQAIVQQRMRTPEMPRAIAASSAFFGGLAVAVGLVVMATGLLALRDGPTALATQAVGSGIALQIGLLAGSLVVPFADALGVSTFPNRPGASTALTGVCVVIFAVAISGLPPLLA